MRKRIGEIIEAEWNNTTQSIDFTIEFQPSGYKLKGSCPSGKVAPDRYISSHKLKEKIAEFKKLLVYDPTGKFDPENLSPETFRKLRVEISLTGGGIRVLPPEQKPDENFFLSRILKS